MGERWVVMGAKERMFCYDKVDERFMEFSRLRFVDLQEEETSFYFDEPHLPDCLSAYFYKGLLYAQLKASAQIRIF